MPACRHNLCVVKILSVLGIVLLCALGLQAQTVVINLASMGANPSTNRNVTTQALSPTIGNLVFYVSDTTTGAVEFVPQPGIFYQVVIKSPPAAILFGIYVPAPFSGTMDATNFTSLAPNAVQTFPAAQTAPSWQSALATFQLSGSAFSNNFPTFVQTTNIARSVYSNNPAGYFQAIFTNGFWTTNYIGLNFYPSNNPSGYTTAGVTNGFAPTNWVGANYYPTSNPSLFTPATITNGFAPTNWVGQNFVLQSGQVTNTAGLSNLIWFAKQPASPILTNLAGLSNTNQLVYTNDTTWFDTNGAGLLQANRATNNMGLPSGKMAFVPTNAYAPWDFTTNGLANDTNGINVGSGLMAFQPTNKWASYDLATNWTQQISNALGNVSSGGIATMNGKGTNTTLTNGIVFSSTNFNVLGGLSSAGGTGSGTITFPNGDTIREYSSGTGGGGEFGMAIGYQNTAPLYEIFTSIFGASNDVAAAQFNPLTGDTILGVHNIITFDPNHVGGGNWATIAGGHDNFSSGEWSFISGGMSNSVGNLGFGSWVGGIAASTTNAGCFVWNDYTSASTTVPFSSSGSNQFLIHSLGGVGINTTNPAGFTLNVFGSINATNFLINSNASGSIWGAMTNLTLAYRAASSYYFVTNSKPYYGILTTN
jgi:hypothetical protein